MSVDLLAMVRMNDWAHLPGTQAEQNEPAPLVVADLQDGPEFIGLGGLAFVPVVTPFEG